MNLKTFKSINSEVDLPTVYDDGDIDFGKYYYWEKASQVYICESEYNILKHLKKVKDKYNFSERVIYLIKRKLFEGRRYIIFGNNNQYITFYTSHGTGGSSIYYTNNGRYLGRIDINPTNEQNILIYKLESKEDFLNKLIYPYIFKEETKTKERRKVMRIRSLFNDVSIKS